MKTQNKTLVFRKNSVVELNKEELLTVNGGTTPVCAAAAAAAAASSATCAYAAYAAAGAVVGVAIAVVVND